MKKVTKSREFDPDKENQPIKSDYKKTSEHSLIKSFTQKADKNNEDPKIQTVTIDVHGAIWPGITEPSQKLEISKSEDYVEKPISDVKPAKGKFVKIKKSIGKIAQIEKGGPRKFPSERKENMPTGGKVAKTEEKACGAKYKKMIDYMKKKSLESGSENNPIMKSLDSIDGNRITDEQFSIFEKACMLMDVEALVSWIDLMSNLGANVTMMTQDEEVANVIANKLNEKKSQNVENEIEETTEIDQIDKGNSPELNSKERFENLVNELKEKSIKEGITKSSIIDSILEVSSNEVTNDDVDELENILKAAKDPSALAEWIGKKKLGNKNEKKLEPEEKEKSLSSASGSGGDLIAPQMAGQKKKLVKVKKSLEQKSFFAQSDCQQA